MQLILRRRMGPAAANGQGKIPINIFKPNYSTTNDLQFSDHFPYDIQGYLSNEQVYYNILGKSEQ